MEATDSDGHVATQAIDVFVGEPDNPPTVTIDQPQDGSYFPSGHLNPLELRATARDPRTARSRGRPYSGSTPTMEWNMRPIGQGTTVSTTLSWDDEDQPGSSTAHSIIVEATEL